MSTRRSAIPFVLVLIAIGLASAACGRSAVGAASPSAAPTPSLPPASEPLGPTNLPSGLEPAPTQPSIEPSIEPSAPADRSAPTITEPPIPEPPAASIAVEGGDPVIAQLGSFAWLNSGSDAPWIRGAPIHVGTGERLTLTFAAPVDLEIWHVARTPATTLGSGIVGMAEGTSGPVTFAAPPPGSWSVSVSVWFAHNAGSASYYWLLTVD